MRDIVATIQPEQDEIVRSGLSGTVCVQGGPGTGKTAVGLHRVAYLLYAHRERLARTGTLVIGPNDSFLRYIEQVLPALGELTVHQATVDSLVAHVPVTGSDPAPTAIVKGDARMAEVLRRALRSHVGRPTESLVVVRGSRRWRVPADEITTLIEELLARDIRYGAAREALPQRIAHAVLIRMEQAGEAPDDRVQNAVARDRAVKALVKEVWPPVDPAKLVLRLLGDADFLRAHSEDLLTDEERAALLWPKPYRGVKSARWSAADAVLIDEARDLVERTPPSATSSSTRPRTSPHAVPRRGPPLLHRLRHRPRRPRPGHHRLGHPRLARSPPPPRQTRRPRGRTHGRLPRPPRGHRLRVTPPPRHRPRSG
ncbi:UvrD-helicase domain-containing protein [Actinomadura keratinilytica]